MTWAISIYLAYCATVWLFAWRRHPEIRIAPPRTARDAPAFVLGFLLLPLIVPPIVGLARAYRRIAGNGPPAAERRPTLPT